MKKVLVAVLVSLVMVTSAGVASAQQSTSVTARNGGGIFVHRTGLYHVSVSGWTRGYHWVYFEVDVKSGWYKEPSTARVEVTCQGGFHRRFRWYDGDGTSTRAIYIRNARKQGRCIERLHAYTDDGVYIWAGIGGR